MRIPARPRSLWIATAPGRPFPRLRQDVEVDVAKVRDQHDSERNAIVRPDAVPIQPQFVAHTLREVLPRNGMVVTTDRYASEVGLEVLRDAGAFARAARARKRAQRAPADRGPVFGDNGRRPPKTRACERGPTEAASRACEATPGILRGRAP